MKSKLPFLSWHFSTWNDNNVWNTAAFSQLEGETAYSLKMESKKIQGPYWSWMHPVTVDLRFHTSHYSLTQFYVYRLGIEARRQTHQVGFLPLTHNPSHNYSYIIIPKITPSLCLSPSPPCWPRQTQMPRCKQFPHFRLPKEMGLWTHAIMRDLACLLKKKIFFFFTFIY